MKTIGSKIVELRKQKGMTQEELSESAHINLRTLQRIEKSQTDPRGNTLKNICKVLDVDIKDILDYDKIEDRRFLIFFHLSVLSFIFLPLGNIILPLILWLMKRDKIIHLDKLGVGLLNSQISWTILVNLFFLLFAFFKIQHWLYSYIFILFAGLLVVMNIVFSIAAAVQIRKSKIDKVFWIGLPFIRN